MAIWLALILTAYLLGSVPAAHLAARFFGGINLRSYGTGQVGAGNLWRMTSWKLGLPVGIFDGSKGLVMVWVAQMVGLTVAQQLVVGVAAIIGHNWPVFLRFFGGRGVGTAMGVIFILPFINTVVPWMTIAFFTILILGSIILRSSPVPVFLSTMSLPVVSAFFEPVTISLAFLAIFAIIVVKRLTAPRSAETSSIGLGRLLLNRLLFDRDIMDRRTWVYRVPRQTAGGSGPEEG
jgi:glycerol-3-phosphate acyltransferase PlsY